MKHALALLFTVLFTTVSIAQIPQEERAALEDLYTATQGDRWNERWDLSQPATTFPGVTIVDGHVTQIRLLFNNLRGELPSSIDQLSKLKVLELSFNKIYGVLPEQISNLKELEILALNGNAIEGAIPNSIGNLTQLKQLHLSSNQLNGKLPNTLDQLDVLEVFNVFDNNLEGDLPLVLAQKRSLKEFLVAENNFNTTSKISNILLSNSGSVNLEDNMLTPTAKSVIAIESSDDDN